MLTLLKMDYLNTKECINNLLQYIQHKISEITVIFLANVKNITVNVSDYYDTSIITEFLSISEYEELLTALQNYGFYTITYFNVNEFISDYLAGKYSQEKLVIFEGTQKGIGHAKDALIPSFCDLEKLIHTGPNAYANSICSNKYHWTKLLEFHSIPVPKSWRYDSNLGWLMGEAPSDDKMLIAKPIYECASIGINCSSVAYYSENYEKNLKKVSLQYKQPLIVQEFIEGYEVEVPVIIRKSISYVLPPTILVKDGNAYMGCSYLDFNNIYEDDYDFCLLETVNRSLVPEIENCAKKIICLLELDGYIRIDFRIHAEGCYYVTDINSYPHIVKHSSYSYAFKALDFEEKDIIPCLIGNTIINNS